MERAILHSDLNCFYASVETMLDPGLRNKAVAVCGSTEDRHGIVLAKSEKAKRAGVKTGMVNWEARRVCPELITVPPQYDQYLKYSKLTRSIYQRYTDMIEPFGMDECWLDVTSSRVYGSPMEIAESIREITREELGLTVSIGVSFNKIFAKLGSDMKKPDAITEITSGNFKEKVWPLPASDLLYVGPATERKLADIGIHTIGDLAALTPDYLKRMFGVKGYDLWAFANGQDESRVMHKDFVSPVKSIGHGITCTADLVNEEEVWRVILELSQDIGHKLRLHQLNARTVQLCIRDGSLYSRQFQCRLPFVTQLPDEIAKTAFRAFQDNYKWTTSVRSVTVRAIELQSQSLPRQCTLFRDEKKLEERERLQDTIEDIRRRYGKHAIMNASLLGDLKMPIDRDHEVVIPGTMYR